MIGFGSIKLITLKGIIHRLQSTLCKKFLKPPSNQQQEDTIAALAKPAPTTNTSNSNSTNNTSQVSSNKHFVCKLIAQSGKLHVLIAQVLQDIFEAVEEELIVSVLI
jgi:hypothetical protein